MTDAEVAIAEMPDSSGIRVGTVSIISPLTVSLQGGTIVRPGQLAARELVVGDTVALMRQDQSWLCLGRIDLATGQQDRPKAKIQQNAVQTLVNGATEKVLFQQLIYDNNGMADVATSRIYCRTPGLYRAETQLSVDSTGATILLGILSSSTPTGNVGLETNPNAGTSFWGPYMQMSGTVRMVAGEWVEVFIVQLSGASRNTTLTFVPCWLTLEWIGV